MDRQVTLQREVALAGVGLHGGEVAEVVLRPLAAGAGVVLKRLGEPFEQRLKPDLVKASPLCTLLENDRGVTVSTVEHLLSALHGLGVDNVLIEVAGPEVPILDGSALPWVQAIDRAGRRELEAKREWLKVEKPLLVEREGRILEALPDPRAGLRVECLVEFPHPMIGQQVWKGVVDEETYRREIAPARTFVLERDILAAQAVGLVKGGSLENAVVFGEDGTVKNKEGLRFIDEPVRHKVLDAVGDFYMSGRCVWGRLNLNWPGHVGNNLLLREMVG